MNRFESVTGGAVFHSAKLPKDVSLFAGFNPLMWIMALMLAVVVTGCGGGASVLGVGGSVTSLSFKVKPVTTVSIPVNGTQQYAAIETFNDGSTIDRTSVSAWTAPDLSGGPGVATLSANGATGGLATGKVAGTSTITASYSINGIIQHDSSILTVSPKTLLSLSVGPQTATLPVNGTQQYTATAIWSDQTSSDVTTAASGIGTSGTSWTVADATGGPGVATISANGATGGLATGKVAGTATITASYTINGITKTANLLPATLTVNAKTLTSLSVGPQLVSIPVNGTQQYTATATWSDQTSTDVTTAVAGPGTSGTSWTATDATGGPGVATLSANGTTGGLATGKVAGTATISASYTINGITKTANLLPATLTVSAKTLLSLSVGPQAASIPVNGTQQYTATATWSDQTSSDVTAAATTSWTATDATGGPGVATLSANGGGGGLATGKVSGTASITASYTIGGITKTANLLPATLTVSAKTLTSLSVGPQTASISVNGTQQYAATATWSDQTSSDVTAAATTSWTVTDAAGGPGVATLSANGVGGGLATGAVIGTSSITASYTFGGIAKTANLLPATLTVTAGIGPVPLAINLGSAATYGIASQAGLTSTGVTVVNGDVALYPTATCTDSTGNAGASETCLTKIHTSPTGLTVNGSIYFAGDPFDNGATALSVTTALNTAWIQGKNMADTQAGVLGGQLAGKTLTANVYDEAALNLAAGGTATFDAQGNPNAIFIIKVTSSFTDSGTLLFPTQIKLINGALARNIWFVVGLDVSIGSGTTWNGNILAGRTTTVNNGSSVMGRVLSGASGAGAFTITGAASPSLTSITVPPN